MLPAVMTLTGSFPERADASARSTFDGTVTITNTTARRIAALSASQPDVYVKQAGAVVAAPVPRDDVGLVLDLAPGEARSLIATGSLRRRDDPAAPLPPGRYEVHAVLRFADMESAVGGPWELEIGAIGDD
jgi:hypothetical protein